jgi:dTDP-4-amino-4,6-dideoxy-D-glucose/dTDP-4-amino-2,4-dideoxy-beta-L-xylose transaminase
MKEKGVFASQVHQRNDINTCVKQFETVLPNLNEFQKGLVCIPVGWWVSEENREYIVECIKSGW